MNNAREPAVTTPLGAVADILFHVHGIADMMNGVDMRAFNGSYPMLCSVERASGVIATRLRSLPPALLANYPELNWKEFVAIADILQGPRIHADAPMRWGMATGLIPQLEGPLSAMLKECRRVEAALG
jgi:uncharacterized protein with HEPN domain